jgi:hypothetical protein
MRFRCVLLCSLVVVSLLYMPVRVAAQAADAPPLAEDSAGEPNAPVPAVVPLIPLLEAAFSGNLRWRPDWPEELPPDAFSLPGEGPDAPHRPLSITLSNGTETYTFRRDSAGRLREFPFFMGDSAVRVRAAYGPGGELLSMSVSAALPAADARNADARNADAHNATDAHAAAESEGLPAESAETVWDCVFPADFTLYGGDSRSGALAPVTVSAGGAAFFVLLRESPAALSETWYDGEGSPLVHYNAPVLWEQGSWHIRSLRTWDGEGPRLVEYAVDSGGNISEVRSPEGRFTALYQGTRPRYWERQPAARPAGEGEGEPPESPHSRSVLHWDARGFLESLSLENAADSPETPVEYRYEYTQDAGNWIKRQDIAITGQFGVFVPRPGLVWTRAISFTEE